MFRQNKVCILKQKLDFWVCCNKTLSQTMAKKTIIKVIVDGGKTALGTPKKKLIKIGFLDILLTLVNWNGQWNFKVTVLLMSDSASIVALLPQKLQIVAVMLASKSCLTLLTSQPTFF